LGGKQSISVYRTGSKKGRKREGERERGRERRTPDMTLLADSHPEIIKQHLLRTSRASLSNISRPVQSCPTPWAALLNLYAITLGRGREVSLEGGFEPVKVDVELDGLAEGEVEGDFGKGFDRLGWREWGEAWRMDVEGEEGVNDEG
jgi:hypothetical protein